MKKTLLTLIYLFTATSLFLSASAVDQTAIENLETNIRVLKEQFEDSASQLKTIREQLPRKLGLYEGTLVGRYQLETQIRKQEAKLYSLKTGHEADPDLAPEITVVNQSPLKLLLTLHSTDPEFDGLDYFTFQDMEIHFPIRGVTWIQISDFTEDSIYPIYKVDEISSDKKLILKLEGFSYEP